MLSLFTRRRADPTIDRLYGAIVAQARHPDFYAHYGVPDTPEGRFEMIVLHLALVLRQLRGGSDAVATAAQALFDRFCADMDGNLREMGISDTGVPRTMRKLGEAFYGRAQTYDRALAGEPDALTDALERIVFGAPASGAQALGEYMRRLAAALVMQAPQDVLAAPAFPPVKPHQAEQEP